MKRIALLIFAVIESVRLLGAEIVSLPSKENVHLYLLIGQSNMAGRGLVEEQDRTPHPRVMTFTTKGHWKPAVDPLHSDRPNAGVGLGLTFAKTMAEKNKSVTIGLVPCAVGGTPLSRWSKGGDLYEKAITRAKQAMQDGTLKGILWHQGENDALTNTTAETYADRLSQMIVDLRQELGASRVPFVAGEIGGFLYTRVQTPFARLVNEQMNQIPRRVPKTAVVPAKGLTHNGDQVHFDSPALREFGKRYAIEMFRLQKTGASQPSTRR